MKIYTKLEKQRALLECALLGLNVRHPRLQGWGMLYRNRDSWFNGVLCLEPMEADEYGRPIDGGLDTSSYLDPKSLDANEIKDILSDIIEDFLDENPIYES